MEEGLMCFDTTKREAQNASHTAEMAFNISEQAKEVSCWLSPLAVVFTFVTDSVVYIGTSRQQIAVDRWM